MRTLTLGLAALCLLTLGALTMHAEERDYLKAFPEASEGMKRFVIQLPHKERGVEDDFRVELFVGKHVLTDGVNQVRLGGQLKALPLKGWGFTYYELNAFGPAASTLMAAPPGTEKQKRFVITPPLMIRYNSRVPIVIYAPQDAVVKYRVWEAPEELAAVEEG